jgi:hypothetical protein
MKKVNMFTAAISLMSFAACSTAKRVIVPLTNKAEVEDTYTIIWNGSSTAYRFVDNNWVRAENYDYVFDVVQKRYNNKWKSVKSLHRLHPSYDGKAGRRDQTMYFELAFSSLKDEKVGSTILSSLGDGTGITDKEFRNQELVMYVKMQVHLCPTTK